jgi:hypothetical protein
MKTRNTQKVRRILKDWEDHVSLDLKQWYRLTFVLKNGALYWKFKQLEL